MAWVWWIYAFMTASLAVNCIAGHASLISSNYTGRVSGNGSSDQLAITPDGRFVAFASRSSDLETTDADTSSDIYLVDMMTGVRKCVTAGFPASGFPVGSYYLTDTPLLTPDGRFVAFRSNRTNLVAGMTNFGAVNLFIYDVLATKFTLVGVREGGGTSHMDDIDAPALSVDGRYASFEAATPFRIYRRDLKESRTEVVNVDANGLPAPLTLIVWRVSTNGEFFAFASNGSNVLKGVENTNNVNQVYWRDMRNDITKLVSVTADGSFVTAQAFVRAISPDGRYVAFKTRASNVVAGVVDQPGDDLFIRDMILDETWCVTMNTNGVSSAGSAGIVRDVNFSADGSKIIFISDGRDLAWGFSGGNPYAAYIHDLQTRSNRVGGPNLGYLSLGFVPGVAQLSGNGRYTVVTRLNDLLATDIQTTRTVLIGKTASNPSALTVQLTENGKHVFFVSPQSEAPGTIDTNNSYDVFVAATMPPKLTAVRKNGSHIVIDAVAFPGDALELEASSDLNEWEDSGLATVTEDGTATILDEVSHGALRRFYRLVSP